MFIILNGNNYIKPCKTFGTYMVFYYFCRKNISMIEFKELYIDPQHKCLIIDVYIEDLSYYEGVVIDSIILDTENKYLPSEEAYESLVLYSQDNPSMNILNTEGGRHVRIELNQSILDVLQPEGTEYKITLSNNHMYTVTVNADTSNAPNIGLSPCGCSEATVTRSLMDMQPIYNSLMAGIKQVAADCTIPKTLIDNVLRMNALDSALKTGNYPLAAKFWNTFYSNSTTPSIKTRNCGCHGY